MISKLEVSCLPPIVKGLSHLFDGWVVGSNARALLLGETPKSDWDVIVPPHRFRKAMLYLRTAVNGDEYARGTTSMGGLRFSNLKTNEVVDIWPSYLNEFIEEAPPEWTLAAVHIPTHRGFILGVQNPES